MTALTQPHARGRMRHMLLAAVLLLCYTAAFSAATEHHCMFDRMAKKAGPPLTAMVLKLPRQGRSGVSLMTASGPESNWAPIRIEVFTEDMKDEARYCTEVGQWRSRFDGGYTLCELQDVLTPNKKEVILHEVIPQATKLHTDRLLVQPITDSILVPRFSFGVCSEFTIPSSHHTEGVDGVDMVLYAAVGITHSGVNAWSTNCASLDSGRPVIGVITFSARSAMVLEESVRTAAHEIAHALGFYIELFLERKMVKGRRSVRGKPYVLLVRSPKTLQKARAHYNCSTAPGMELEDEGKEGTAGSHWEMRNAKDELMSGISRVGYYTALTMAAFEDTGFYRANWSMAETMSWGRNSGCNLLEKKCLTNGTSEYPDMFCSSVSTDKNIMSCTSNRRELGKCSIYSYNVLPPRYQYFGQLRLGGAVQSLTDLCPVIEPFYNTNCTDSSLEVVPGSRVGPTSRCLKGSGLQYKGRDIGDVCAEVQCDNKSRTVKVRYLDNDTWHECPEGNHIEPKGSFSRGMIVCPKYHEVCIETGADASEVDPNPMKVDKNDASAEKEHDTFLPSSGGFLKEGENVGVKIESSETEATSMTAGSDTKEFNPTEDPSSNLLPDPILGNLRSVETYVGGNNGGVSAEFSMPFFLLLTALSFVALY